MTKPKQPDTSEQPAEELSSSFDDDDELNLASDTEERAFKISSGVVNLYMDNMSRGFAQVPDRLKDGVCGAPVLTSTGKCIGMVEGIVPESLENSPLPKNLQDLLVNNAAFIQGHQLIKVIEFHDGADKS